MWERVHLTWPAATARVEKLEENGVIEGSNIKVNLAIRCFM
ncbi:winged helix-turn-helix transcriptional regulator [Bacillus inaquosorum]|nr:winged helix-turn-helix transcriptional regulator [Bacillus inaquosorum]